jgi:hypothetical protein
VWKGASENPLKMVLKMLPSAKKSCFLIGQHFGVCHFEKQFETKLDMGFYVAIG